MHIGVKSYASSYKTLAGYDLNLQLCDDLIVTIKNKNTPCRFRDIYSCILG